MPSDLTTKIKTYFNRGMAQRAAQHTLFWPGVPYLQCSKKSLSSWRMKTSPPTCLPCTSAGLNVRLGAGTVSRRSAHYIMTELPSRETK